MAEWCPVGEAAKLRGAAQSGTYRPPADAPTGVIIAHRSDYSDYICDRGGIVMLRTQIQITEEQSRRLQQAARSSGVSVAEVIRRSVDLYLDREAPRPEGAATREAAARVAGMFRSGKSDIAARHDDYLDEAYAG
jgi:hypothetical protein